VRAPADRDLAPESGREPERLEDLGRDLHVEPPLQAASQEGGHVHQLQRRAALQGALGEDAVDLLPGLCGRLHLEVHLEVREGRGGDEGPVHELEREGPAHRVRAGDDAPAHRDPHPEVAAGEARDPSGVPREAQRRPALAAGELHGERDADAVAAEVWLRSSGLEHAGHLVDAEVDPVTTRCLHEALRAQLPGLVDVEVPQHDLDLLHEPGRDPAEHLGGHAFRDAQEHLRVGG
jgi:hypothetical protein